MPSRNHHFFAQFSALISTPTGMVAIALTFALAAERLTYYTFVLTHERLFEGAIGFALGIALAIIYSRTSWSRKVLEPERLAVTLLLPAVSLILAILFINFFLKHAFRSQISDSEFHLALTAIVGGSLLMDALIRMVRNRSLYAILFRFK